MREEKCCRVIGRIGTTKYADEWYAYDEDRLVLTGGLSTHRHVFKSELKSG
jgi:hypothetical protein